MPFVVYWVCVFQCFSASGTGSSDSTALLWRAVWLVRSHWVSAARDTDVKETLPTLMLTTSKMHTRG